MTIALKERVMPMEVSALNTYWLVQYIQEHYSHVDFNEILEEISGEIDCYVKNLQTGNIELVTPEHLLMPRYWFSHMFVQALHDKIRTRIPDPILPYKIGRSMYKTKPLIRTTLGVSLLGVHGVAKKVSEEAAKYNKTKTYSVRTLEKGFVVLRIVHNPGLVVNEATMQWNAGCFASYAQLAGATNVHVEMRCVESGPGVAGGEGRAIWDFEIKYTEPGVLNRLFKATLLMFPWVRRLTEEAERIEADYQEQILTRDAIIKERTDHLLAIQAKLIEQERKSIESKLAKISEELVTSEEKQRRAIAEDLHDSVTQLLALSLKKIKETEKSHKEIEGLGEIRSNLGRALADLRSLTFHISPPVLYDFGLEAALEWLIKDVNTRHEMSLVYTSLVEIPLAPGARQQVALYRAVRELVVNIIKHAKTADGQVLFRTTTTQLVIEVADEGVGFDTSVVKDGFGLFSLEDRLFFMNGKLHIMSTPGEGTIVQIRVPLEKLSPDTP